ncbi:lipopolysaccharide heptosyltransferase II [Simkania negevensis]|nr:lipopolysaccharide heptosyltransferase II [Simkania negevensis]
MKKLQPKNIIVRMPNWIGDLVMATPILTDLRFAFPDASITAMVYEKIGPLIEADPAIDELFLFSRAKGMIRRIRQRNIVEKLRDGNYDLGLLLTNSFSSAWRFWQGGVKNKVGFSGDGRSFLLDQAVPFPKERKTQHLVLTYKALLKHIGIPRSETAPRLFLKKDEKEGAWDFVKRFDIPAEAKLIGINPGAAYGSAKCWLPERFREVAKRLIDEDPSHFVLFFGDLSHKQLINEICTGLPARAVNLAGQTDLRLLLALISICSVFLTNDSGPMHIADSLDIPLVALFGSTDPIATGPYRHGQAVMQKKVPCSPCFKRVCPIDFPCMKGLTVEDVFNRVLKTLHQNEQVTC